MKILIPTIRRYNKDTGMEFSIEKICLADYEKRKKRNSRKNSISKYGKNQYLRILETDISKQAEMKEKKSEKSTSDEQENFSKPNSNYNRNLIKVINN